MSSSISNSEPAAGIAPAPAKLFFSRALAMLLVTVAVAVGGGRLLGKTYKPTPLIPSSAELATCDTAVLTFGNSRFAAMLDPGDLARRLSRPGHRVRVFPAHGAGWDTVHYYMLARLAQGALRPRQDVVLIDASEVSLDDAESSNRLGVIRPEAAWQTVMLPGLPTESRLDVLLGATSALYRYRGSLQEKRLQPLIAAVAARIGTAALSLGLIGPSPYATPWQVTLDPANPLAVKSVAGDKLALRMHNRANWEQVLAKRRAGGHKFAALQRAIEDLDAHGVRVVVVNPPTSTWFEQHRQAAPVGPQLQACLQALTAQSKATVVDRWPAEFHDEAWYFDDTHLFPAHASHVNDVLIPAIAPSGN